MDLTQRGFRQNEHGVWVDKSHSGTMFGNWQPDGSFKTCIPIDVPVVCLSCEHYDGGEPGEYGELLSGPTCGLNLNFPTRKGECKRYLYNGWAVRWHESEEVPTE